MRPAIGTGSASGLLACRARRVALRHTDDLSEPIEIVHGETGALEYLDGQTPAKVSPRVHWHSYRSPVGMTQHEVASRLAVVGEALRSQEGDKLASRHLRHPRHAGMPIVSSSR